MKRRVAAWRRSSSLSATLGEDVWKRLLSKWFGIAFAPRRRRSLAFLPLERRELLATLTDSGELRVAGTAMADVISVESVPNLVRVTVNGVTEEVASKAIARVLVDGGSGNDQITVNAGSVPVEVLGGDGNDRVTGGPAGDTLDGGNGADTIYGGAGDDRIVGGAGRDLLFGEGGDDWLASRDGESDSVDGGAGRDAVPWDSLDTLANFEISNPFTPAPDNQAMRVKVLAVSYDPLVPSEGYRPLSEVMGWYNPRLALQNMERDYERATGGFIDFEIVEWREVDGIPEKVDGFQYEVEDYVQAWRAGGPFHSPDGANYPKMMADAGVAEKVRQGEIDQVWLIGAPYFGFWETAMAGPGAFFINGQPYPEINSGRPFMIVGMNYERGESGNNVHGLGHAMESIMATYYGGWQANVLDHNWARFAANAFQSNGVAAVGSVHYPFNGVADYDYGNNRFVLTSADDWLDYPHLTGRQLPMNSGAWTRTEALYEPWWWAHIPRAPGINADGRQNNWLKYFADLHNYNQDGSAKAFRAVLYTEDRYNGGAGAHRFQVAFSSPLAVRRDSLDSLDIIVEGPNGFQASPTLVSVSDSRDSTYLVATYELPAPGGTWDAVDFGEYRIRVAAGEVFDRANLALAAGLLGSFLYRGQVGAGPGVDADTTFLLRLDGDRTSVDGETPIQFSGGTFVPGVSGQALHLGDEEYIRFAAANNVNSTEGTIEFWVKPDWPGNAPGPANHVFFWIGLYPHNFMSIQNDNWDNVFWVVTHGDNPRTPDLETTSGESLRTSMTSWEANVWRHVAVTWRNSGMVLEAYFDGVHVGTQSAGIRIPEFSESFFALGTDTSRHFWANAALDEFRISSRARSAAEINAGYRATLGLTTLFVDGAESEVGMGETQRLRGWASSESGAELRVSGRQIGWTSNQPAIATVDADGVVRGVGVGTATITATLGDLEAEVMITVVDPGRPTAAMAMLANVTANGAAPLDITVVYSDPDLVDSDSVNLGDVLVRGPHGFAAFATVVSVTASGDERQATAIYRVVPRSGQWRVEDNGQYFVELIAEQVRDGTATAALSQRLGQFQVAIPPAVNHVADFALGTSPQLRLLFSADVGASLEAADFAVVALPGLAAVPADRIVLAYDAATRSAQVTVNNLAPGSYRLTLPRLAASDRAGVPLAADAVAEFTAESNLVPPPPSAITTAAGNRAVRVSWSAPTWTGPPITDYVVQMRLEGRPWSTLSDGVSTRTFATAANLQQGKPYYFRIAAVNAYGTGQFSVETAAVVPVAVPDMVKEITGTRGNGFVQLRWVAPTVTGDGPITNYRVQYSADNGVSWTTFVRAASRATSVAVTGLANGTAYFFRVAAFNRLGMGLDAISARAVTPATIPGAPTGVTAIVTGQEIQVSWTAPVSNGGSPIVNYVVQYRDMRTSKWVPLSRPVSASTTAVAKLPRNASYMFRVTANTAIGSSPVSAPSSVVKFP